jgi:ribosomal-protein-alanine N-acetyltransferase
LENTPDFLLETKRLSLRRISDNDQELFKMLFCDPVMMRYLGEPWTLDQANEAHQEWRDEWGKKNYYYGVIVRKDTRAAIGIAGISEDSNPEEPGIEFSWFVHPEHQGNGYATEITVAIMKFVFDVLKKDRLFGETHPENPGSNEVLRKLHFRNVGERNHKFNDLPDFNRQVVWEFTRKDWDNR